MHLSCQPHYFLYCTSSHLFFAHEGVPQLGISPVVLIQPRISSIEVQRRSLRDTDRALSLNAPIDLPVMIALIISKSRNRYSIFWGLILGLSSKIPRYNFSSSLLTLCSSFLGSSAEPVGLLFTEANCGDLQRYLDSNNGLIRDIFRLKWRLQAAEAIAYLHSKGVIHSDLRPENFLLHIYNDNDGPELLLSDFGGSYCEKDGRTIDGNHLPDAGFFNPTKPWISTEDTDIFALGSVFYTIMTGHWLYRLPGPFVSVEEQVLYGEKVNELFTKRAFPPIEDLIGGDIIHECWTEKIEDAGTIVSRHKSLIQKREQSSRGLVGLAYKRLLE